MNSPLSPNPYDEVLYAGHPFAQTHPDRLATMARLFGMNPAPVDACRVLELGCGDGGNLIPMAYTLPQSEFVGLDLGVRGIAKGQETVNALGLRNMRIECRDILNAGAELGMFDYILAHGVYSWVPAAVQDRILAICSDHLHPQGVAYISYAVYPGAHVRTMMAEMLKYHAHRFRNPEQQIEQAGALLLFLSTAHPGNDAYGQLLRQEVESLATRRIQSIYHDELSECQPVYFRNFVERAGHHDLQYLGEADFFEMVDASLPAPISETLRKMARDPIDKEQYLDFLKCRRFRQTLLCHAKAPLKRAVQSAQMRDFYISTGACRNEQPERTPSDHPVAKAALAALLAEWPGALSFEELKRRSGAGDDLLLADLVLGFFACGIFQLHAVPSRFATVVSERPKASALSRHQARTEPFVTNLCHGVVHLEDDLSLRLLQALDGTRDRASLAEEMRKAVSAEQLATLENDLGQALQMLAKLALLEA